MGLHDWYESRLEAIARRVDSERYSRRAVYGIAAVVAAGAVAAPFAEHRLSAAATLMFMISGLFLIPHLTKLEFREPWGRAAKRTLAVGVCVSVAVLIGVAKIAQPSVAIWAYVVAIILGLLASAACAFLLTLLGLAAARDTERGVVATSLFVVAGVITFAQTF